MCLPILVDTGSILISGDSNLSTKPISKASITKLKPCWFHTVNVFSKTMHLEKIKTIAWKNAGSRKGWDRNYISSVKQHGLFYQEIGILGH